MVVIKGREMNRLDRIKKEASPIQVSERVRNGKRVSR